MAFRCLPDVAIATESIGWLPLGDGAYLHVGDPDVLVIEVARVPDTGFVGKRVASPFLK